MPKGFTQNKQQRKIRARFIGLGFLSIKYSLKISKVEIGKATFHLFNLDEFL